MRLVRMIEERGLRDVAPVSDEQLAFGAHYAQVVVVEQGLGGTPPASIGPDVLDRIVPRRHAESRDS